MNAPVQLQRLVAPSSPVSRTDEVSDIGNLIGREFQSTSLPDPGLHSTVACAACLYPCLPPLVAHRPGDIVQCRSTAKVHSYDAKFGPPNSWSVKHRDRGQQFTIEVAHPQASAVIRRPQAVWKSQEWYGVGKKIVTVVPLPTTLSIATAP